MILLKSKADWKLVATSRGLAEQPLFYPAVLANYHEFVYPSAFVYPPAYQWFVVLDGVKLRINHLKFRELLFQENLSLSTSGITLYEVLIEEGTLKGQRVRVPMSRLVLE